MEYSADCDSSVYGLVWAIFKGYRLKIVREFNHSNGYGV